LIFNLGVQIDIYIYLFALGFAVAVITVIWWLSQHMNNEGEDAVLKIHKRIIYIINENPDSESNVQMKVAKPLILGKEKTYEGINTKYRGFLYESMEAGKDIVIIWNCNENCIAEMNSVPSYDRKLDLFRSFSPYEGKFKTAPNRTEIKQETYNKGDLKDEEEVK
jgi:hypothetical protein